MRNLFFVLITLFPFQLFSVDIIPDRSEDSQKTTIPALSSEKPLGKTTIQLDVAGFILFGPTLTLETKIANNMYLTPHIRYFYLGALMYGLQTEFNTDNKWRAKSASVGAGVRILPERASSPNKNVFWG